MIPESDVELEENFWTDDRLNIPQASGSAFDQTFSPTLNSPQVNALEIAGGAIALLFWPCLSVAV